MNNKCINRRHIALLGILILIIIVYVVNMVEKKDEAKGQFMALNKYLQQEGNLQITRIPEGISVSLYSYHVREIEMPGYWLESTDGKFLQNSCYYIQFDSMKEAMKVWRKIEKKEDFIRINAGVFHISGIDEDTKNVLISAQSFFDS